MQRSIFSLIASGCLLVAGAVPNSIGFVRSTGDFRVDGSTVRGNSTLFDGSVIETVTARSVVQLDIGQLTLAPASRARIFHDRAILEKGAALLRDTDKLVFEANTLQVAPSAKDSVLQVDVQSPSRIAVSARSGSAQVRNASRSEEHTSE